MKQNGHGKAKILSASEIAQLLEALPTVRDRAVAAIGLFTGCRISEICSLRTADTYTVFLLITGYNSNPFHRYMDNSPIPQNP